MRTWLLPCLMLLPAVAGGQGAEPAAPVPVAPSAPATAPTVIAPDPLLAQPMPPQLIDPTVHRHLGFFFRIDVGLGYLHGSNGSRIASGVGLPLGFAFGGAVAEDFILAAECWGMVNTPSQTANGQTLNATGASMGVGGLGLNLTHYFMPVNVYASITPAVTYLSLTTGLGPSGFPNVESTAGFGVKVALGKEWWVSDHWGLGLALEFTFSTNKESGINPPTWTSFGGGFTFSATYN